MPEPSQIFLQTQQLFFSSFSPDREEGGDVKALALNILYCKPQK